MTDVLVVGAGSAGVVAALRAADLGARTALVTSAEFGGMAANDGPVPLRTLAHAGRLLCDARQLGLYGITVGEPILNYFGLLERVREIVLDVRTKSSLRLQIESAGVTIHEHAGMARFVDPHTIERDPGSCCGDGSRTTWPERGPAGPSGRERAAGGYLSGRLRHE